MDQAFVAFSKKLRPFRQIAARLAAGKEPLMEPQDPMLGDYDVRSWFETFSDTHKPNGFGGFNRMEWPDGECYLDQPNIVLVAFSIVEDELIKAIRRN